MWFRCNKTRNRFSLCNDVHFFKKVNRNSNVSLFLKDNLTHQPPLHTAFLVSYLLTKGTLCWHAPSSLHFKLEVMSSGKNLKYHRIQNVIWFYLTRNVHSASLLLLVTKYPHHWSLSLSWLWLILSIFNVFPQQMSLLLILPRESHACSLRGIDSYAGILQLSRPSHLYLISLVSLMCATALHHRLPAISSHVMTLPRSLLISVSLSLLFPLHPLCSFYLFPNIINNFIITFISNDIKQVRTNLQ